ncbi:MAG TPA: hypothetical protein VFQ24_02165 [Terriglobia bacterium]|nr:hypothetical protein [Terriglobia bacterium]
MLMRMMGWVSIPALFLVLWALLWPLSAVYLILVASAVCVGAMVGFQAGRTAKPFWEARSVTISRKVKYEN